MLLVPLKGSKLFAAIAPSASLTRSGSSALKEGPKLLSSTASLKNKLRLWQALALPVACQHFASRGEGCSQGGKAGRALRRKCAFVGAVQGQGVKSSLQCIVSWGGWQASFWPLMAGIMTRCLLAAVLEKPSATTKRSSHVAAAFASLMAAAGSQARVTSLSSALAQLMQQSASAALAALGGALRAAPQSKRVSCHGRSSSLCAALR